MLVRSRDSSLEIWAAEARIDHSNPYISQIAGMLGVRSITCGPRVLCGGRPQISLLASPVMVAALTQHVARPSIASRSSVLTAIPAVQPRMRMQKLERG